MGEGDIRPEGERIRQAVRWISETVKEHPERPRREVILEAETRFDLTPQECEFLEKELLRR